MAHLLFAWELGAGFGHLLTYREAWRRLVADGHTLTLAVQYLHTAARIMSGIDCRIVQAPLPLPSPVNPRKKPVNYSEMLFNCGFAEAANLRVRVRAWQQLFAWLKPDVVHMDYSPTALLATVDSPYCQPHRRLYTSAGFGIPPLSVPMPHYRYWEAQAVEQLQKRDTEILTTINAVRADLQLPAFNAVRDLFRDLPRTMKTVAELDHFANRTEIESATDPFSPWRYIGLLLGANIRSNRQLADQ